tara:strand:- start:880 stop:1002 length:123 start_codon:yes stop_codon:yes gene_type:complete
MKNRKTQQFAKFYLKDIKNKSSKDNNEKSDIDEWNFFSTN